MTGSDSTVHLPTFTRADAVQAARLGMSRAEYIDYQQRLCRPLTVEQTPERVPADERRRVWKGKVQITDTEYETLSMIAALARRFLPTLEQTAVPVTHPSEFLGLREALEDVVRYRWGGTDDPSAAVSDLLGILDTTRE